MYKLTNFITTRGSPVSVSLIWLLMQCFVLNKFVVSENMVLIHIPIV